MKVAILADTHGWLDDRLLAHLQDADEIWHAGDVGSMEVIEGLEQLPGKLRVVYGNIDNQQLRTIAPEYQYLQHRGLKTLIVHIAGKPPRYNSRIRELIAELQPNMLVCGHSHILKVMHDKHNKLLFINPGACGNHGFHKVRTIIKLQISNGKPHDMQIVELGIRGKLG